MVRNARKWLSAVLAVVMMISMISICAVAEEPATDVLYTEDLKVNDGSLDAENVNHYGVFEMEQTEYALSIEKNSENSVYVYKNADGKKGEKIGTVGRMTQSGIITVSLPNHLNDYILTLESNDGTATIDYALRLEKGMVIVEGDGLTATEWEDGVMYYSVPYTSTSIRFKLNTDEVCEVYNGETDRKLIPDGEYYTVDFADPADLWIYLEIGSEPECYDFYLGRLANDECNIESLTVAGGTVEQEDETLYVVTVPKDQTDVVLDMTLSAEAFAFVYNAFDGSMPEEWESPFTVTYEGNDPVPFGVVVYAQNGDYKVYTVRLTRAKSTECELLGVAGAEKVAGGYEAKISANQFFVDAVVSPYATLEIYADAACTQAIEDPFLKLKAAKTEVYLMVVAETGYHVSEPVKLTVQTTATDFNHSGEDIYYQNFYDLGKVAVTGGIGLIEPENVSEETGLELNGRGLIYVQGATIGQRMHFQISALGEYEAKGVRLYADAKKTILLDNAIDIIPDSSGTALYAVLEANGVKEEYLIRIISEVSYTFNDLKAEDWAKEYVEILGEQGVMNGYTDGAFKGANKLTRNEMAALMVRLVGANKDLYAEADYKFKDTTADWAVNYVKAATRMGMISGNPVTGADGEVEGYTYDGEKNATRAEFLKVFGNAMLIHTDYTIEELYSELQLLIDLYVLSCDFKDIESVAEWAKPYVYTAVFMGWIEGSSETDGVYLNADKEINRFEVAAIVVRAGGLDQTESE